MSKGALAILLARVYPESEKGGRGKSSEAKTVRESQGVSEDRLTIARQIIRYVPELADQVIAGGLYFNAAFAEAVPLAGQRAILVALAYPQPTPGKRTSVETTQVNSAVLSQARVIVNSAPDLVDQVIAGGL
jgi:hypothetical protein